MKKLTGATKIGFVRRSEVSSETNDYQLSPKNHHFNTQHEPHDGNSHEQVLEKQPNNTVSPHNTYHDQRNMPSARTLRTISINESNGINNTNIPSSGESTLSTALSKQPLSGLKEISSKTPWSTPKKVLVGLSALIAFCIIVTVPIVLGILLTQQTVTTTTTISTTTTTTSIPVSASWSFDNTTADYYNVYNGQLSNGATYSLNGPGVLPYAGYAKLLYLISTSNQSVNIPTPFLDFTFTSFTIEAWIFPLTFFAGDRGIFSQCMCSTCLNQCLYLILRANHLYAGFTLNDISSSSVLSIGTMWYHVAFVYNYQTQQQILYLNGVQDTIKSNAQPYQGINGSIQIGAAQIFQTTNFFNGYIDNVAVVTRAKSAVEILKDASLAAYYSFDIPYSNYDGSLNGLNGTSTSTISVNGRVNQAMRLTGAASYFQAFGFYQFSYATLLSKPFSISMWISPSSIAASIILQMSVAQLNSTCFNMLGLYSSTNVASQIIAQGSLSVWQYITIFGPFITLNTWTHISWTFSSGNGYTLYVNGNLFGSTGVSSCLTGGYQMIWLTLGYSCTTCYGGYFAQNAYQGSIDEVYFHSRELAQADVTALANP